MEIRTEEEKGERIPSGLHTECGARSQDPEITTCGEIKSQILNQLRHPDAPHLSILTDTDSVDGALCALSGVVNRAATMSAETASGPTEDQVEILEYNFSKVNKHPDPTTLCLIAAEAGLSEEETQKWFKQRLAQWRQSEGLPSECRSVTD